MSIVSWKEVDRIVRKYRLPTPKTRFVKSLKDIEKSGQKIGYPVVLKIFSERGLHKNVIGGVICNIKDYEELVEAYNKIKKNMKRIKTKIDGFLVQEMSCGQEVFVGMKQSIFGPVIAFGLGGIFVEVLNDVSLRIAPVDRKSAEEMIKETKGYQVLKMDGANIDSIIEIIVKVSKLSMDKRDIQEIDFNPVMVNKKYAKVVDIRIIR